MATAEATSLHELCERFRRIYMPAVADAMYHLGSKEQVLPSSLRPLHPEQRIVGEAFTLEGRDIVPRVGVGGRDRADAPLPPDVRALTPDSVLVHTTPAPATAGHFGELTGNSARRAAAQGVILDGNVRDIEGLRAAGLPGLLPRPLAAERDRALGDDRDAAAGDDRRRHGRPGDIVHAEFDGILVVPREHALAVLEKAEEIVGGEGRVREEQARAARWHGLLPDAARYLPAFDLYVLSSRTEGTPISLLEAIHAGVPAIATAVGGVPDVTGPDGALLVPPNDPAALAGAIRAAVNDSAAARDRAGRAAARVAALYALEPWLDRHDAIYRSLDRTPHPRSR